MRYCPDCDTPFLDYYPEKPHPECCRHCATKRDYGSSDPKTCHQSSVITFDDSKIKEKPVLLEVFSKDPATQARYQKYVDKFYREEDDELIRC